MKRHLILGLLLTGLAMMSIESNRVRAQANDNPPANDKETVIRKYDISDLLFSAEDHPLSGDFVPLTQVNRNAANAQANGNLSPQPQQQQIAMDRMARFDEIKKYITDNVATNTWKDNGGDTGTISSSPLRAVLLIGTTPENQKAIEKLLAELRGACNQTIRIRADWILLAPGKIEKLQKNGANDTAALPEISRDLIRALPDSTVHYTASIAALNGQIVHMASGRAKSVVTNVTPVVAPYAVAMDPTVTDIQEGVSLEVSATLGPDSALVDLSSVVTEPNKSVTIPSTQPTMPALEHIDSVLQNFHTTMQVPLNKPVLVGGSTADPAAETPAGKQLYLIIEADSGK